MSRFVTTELTTVSKADRRFWDAQAPTKVSFYDYLYAIGLYDLVEQKPYWAKDADPGGKYRGSPWFNFPTPPQNIETSEPSATTITPTQDGGKFIESQGSIIKDIRISGTVALRPCPITNELIPGMSQTMPGVELSVPQTVSTFLYDDRGLPKKEITGFDDFIFLRNVFRAYGDLKKSNEWARRIVMIWMNVKEGDYFIVEPINFTASREKGNPFSWNYNITLRTIFRYDQLIKRASDPLTVFKAITAGSTYYRQAMNDIILAVAQIQNAASYAYSLPMRVADTLISDALDVYSALLEFKKVGQRLNVATQHKLDKVAEGAALLRNASAFNDMYSMSGLTDAQIEDMKRSYSVSLPTSNYTKSPDKQMQEYKTQVANPFSYFNAIADIDEQLAAYGKIVHENEVIEAADLLRQAAERLKCMDGLFSTSKQVVVEDYKYAYNREGSPFTVGSPLDPNNITIPTSGSETVVGGNETIRAIAKRTMGDESYWKMIAILNNLKPPYIATTASDGVLSPNDKILIPKRAEAQDVDDSAQEINTDAAMTSLSPILKKYGRDIKISNGSSGTDYADLQVNQKGDLEVVESVANVEQAVLIKLSTERGALALHSEFGSLYPIGSKVSLGHVQDFILNFRNTFLQDQRIASIDSLKVLVEGDVMRVGAAISLRQSNIKFPINFTVRVR
jgi:hypothetical protein